MRVTPTQESLISLRQALDELENPKGSVTGAVQKILRAARTVGDEEIRIWCEVQLGNAQYTLPLKKFVKDLLAATGNSEDKEAAALADKSRDAVIKAGIKLQSHLTMDELQVKAGESGGGYTEVRSFSWTFFDDCYLAS